MRILFFIGTLNTGGAERQLSILSKGLVNRGHEVKLVTLYPGGNIEEELKTSFSIDIKSIWPYRSKYFIVRVFQLVLSPIRLKKIIGEVDCIYSMLESANFIAWLANIFNKKRLLIWGIRSSNMEGHAKMTLFDRLCVLVSPFIKLIIVNSHSGLENLINRGYRPKRYEVIVNGIDTFTYNYSEYLRKNMREELGVENNKTLVGIVGRLNPMKDHSVFIEAASNILKDNDEIMFLIVGSGLPSYKNILMDKAERLGLKNKIIWLENQLNVVAIYSAIDILVSSSIGEGFSNVIAEAMSCGVPCVVTDVGDSAKIVGKLGRVVPAKDAKKLAGEIMNVADMIKKGLIKRNNLRKRIQENYSQERFLVETENILFAYKIDSTE